MADFCKQHSIEIFGEDTKDLAGLCKPGETVINLCEGCGAYIEVDHEGNKLSIVKDLMVRNK